jgi:putative hydrolase of the HAD superfamily
MTHAVLFDLFETLVTESTASARRASSFAQDLGVNQDAYRSHWRSRRLDVVLGRCSFRDTLAQIARTLGGTLDHTLLDQLRSERVAQKAAVLRSVDADVLATLDDLRAAGLKLAVVTNCFAEDVAAWDSSPLRAYFDVTVFSCAVGLAKPDSEMYLLACRELHVSPTRALFIGDGGDDELPGARAAGLRADRALWFLSRWPHATIAHDDPGLWRASDVVHAATAASSAWTR